MKEKIEKLIVDSLKEFSIENNIDIDLSNGRKIRLYGGDGKLDSIALVSFIVAIEEKVEENFGVSVILADEKAMSRRTSPFTSVGFLTDYITEILQTQ